MSEFTRMARDPEHRRGFEKLLFLAAKRGDDDLVAERLGWGVDPNCVSAKGNTPLLANVRCSCPNAATVRALLAAGADTTHLDRAGLTALDHARRKLARLEARPRRQIKSPSLDENGQLKLSKDEQAELDEIRGEAAGDRDYMRMWWKERLRAARRTFNDVGEVRAIVEMLEAVEN